MTTMREALEAAEAVMSIVEPRNHKAEYLEVLGKVRAALSTEWRPDPKTVEECAKVAEALFKINGKHVSPAGKAVAEAIRSLANHPSAEKG